MQFVSHLFGKHIVFLTTWFISISQANSYVDMSGIRMHTVAVRSEELKDSGSDLLQWVEYYLGPVVMYASANNTNKIQLTLPQIGEFYFIVPGIIETNFCLFCLNISILSAC